MKGATMKTGDCPNTEKCDTRHDPRSGFSGRSFLRYYVLIGSLVSGFFALCWVMLRSGPKPSRLAYPCQQAAMSAATFTFGVPLVCALIAARRRVAAGLRTPSGIAVAASGLLLTAGVWSYLSRADTYQGPVLSPPATYRANVFYVPNSPQQPAGDRFLGLDDLLLLMGRQGLKFYQSTTVSPLAGPDGIIAADDVIVIKINYQWPERGGTNTDLLRGLLRHIVDHPDTFTGEVVIGENTQTEPIDAFDRSENNAENHEQSPHDVVMRFRNQGFDISHYSWTAIRVRLADEYSEGDLADGYVVQPLNPDVQGRVSYPKFRTDFGTYISLRYGLWDPDLQTYDREGLKFINMPVLKSHHASYGATACVKNYMGVVTNFRDTNSHNGIEFGILGALIGEIRPADLNILGATWINAHPDDGPWCSYEDATRRDELVASVDPVAADIWAVTNILIPAFIDNLYSPPWPYPSADPADPTSRFRTYLDNSMSQILLAGYDVTNDLSQIDVFTWRGGDFMEDGDVDLDDYDQFVTCYTGPGGGPVGSECQLGDFDGDGDVDCADWLRFVHAWTEGGSPPDFAPCPCQLVDAPQVEMPVVAKNRYLSLAPDNPGRQTALRLTFVDVPPPHDAVNGLTMWVAEPVEYCENAGQDVAPPPPGECGPAPGLPSLTLTASTLQCQPDYLDWSEYGTVHVYHEAIVPDGVYEIQAIDETCDSALEAAYSSAAYSTTSRWGDLVSNCITRPCGPPDGIVGIPTDVTAALDKFKNLDGAPMKARCDIEPNIADLRVNISDVTFVVDAFRGFDYPFAPGPPPPPCP